MRRAASHSATPGLGQGLVRAVVWLLVVALLNLSAPRMAAAVAADGDLTRITICTSHGTETLALADLPAEPADQGCSDCPSCATPSSVTPPMPSLAGLPAASLERDVAWARGRVTATGLWFLDGRPLRAPPLA